MTASHVILKTTELFTTERDSDQPVAGWDALMVQGDLSSVPYFDSLIGRVDGNSGVSDYLGVWAISSDYARTMGDKLAGFDLSSHLASVGGKASEETAVKAARGDTRFQVINNSIGVVPLHGTLMKHVGSFDAGTSTVSARRQLRAIGDDDRMKSALLHIDSPGGTVAGTMELGKDIAALAAKKPVYAFIEDLGASAAYWAASQATKVFTNAVGLVGSIGTFATIYDLSKMAEQKGIVVHVVKAGEMKGAGVPGTPVTEQRLAEAQELVNTLNEHFLQAVSTGRRMPLARVREIADGRVHVGDAAKTIDLVDGVRSLDEVIGQLSSNAGRTRSQAAVSSVVMTTDEVDSFEEKEAARKRSERAKQRQSDESDKGKSMSDSVQTAAELPSVDQLREAFPKASDTLLLSMVGKSMDDCRGLYQEDLEQRLEQSESDRRSAKKGKGVETLGNGGRSASSEPDDGESFSDLVAAKMSRNGGNRQRAIASVVRSHPEAHRQYLVATNPGKQRRRLIEEKYDSE